MLRLVPVTPDRRGLLYNLSTRRQSKASPSQAQWGQAYPKT